MLKVDKGDVGPWPHLTIDYTDSPLRNLWIWPIFGVLHSAYVIISQVALIPVYLFWMNTVGRAIWWLSPALYLKIEGTLFSWLLLIVATWPASAKYTGQCILMIIKDTSYTWC